MTAAAWQPIKFGSRFIGPGHPMAIIAEVGINHEGGADTCARLIEAAARAGADAIKLQTIDADENYVKGTASHTLFSAAWLDRETTACMFALARSLGMEAFTTAGDAATLDWVERLDPAAHKISSGLLTHLPVIRHAAATGRTVLLSTGMATVAEIDDAVAATRAKGAAVGLFQCTSIYPAPIATLNLAAVRWLAERSAAPTGFSDHSLGDEASVLSVAAGACMLEKHFTLDVTRPGYDHPISLDERQFAAMVKRIRAAEAMLGRPEKAPAEGERERAAIMRRIVVARRPIKAGETLSWDSVGLKRPLPGTQGLAPREAESLIGRVAARAVALDEPIRKDALVPPR